MKSWPLINRNKVEDSGIEDPVRQLATATAAEDPELQPLAQGVSLFSLLPRRFSKPCCELTALFNVAVGLVG